MANRNYNRAQNLEKEVKSLFAEVSIGATGAATVVSALGIASVARTNAGDYTITLDDKYTRLMHVSVIQLDVLEEDLTFQVASQTVATTKLVKIICKTDATATDPSDGSSLLIKLDLKNSSVGE